MRSILDKSDAELLRILGEYEINQGFSSQPASDSDKERAGRNLLDRLSDKFRQSICTHPLTKKLLYAQDADAAMALGIVMIIVVQVGVFGHAANEVIQQIAALSTLLVRQGIASYCAGVKDA